MGDGWIEIRRNRFTGRYRVVTVGANGEPLSTSESLNSEQAVAVNVAAQRRAWGGARIIRRY